MRAITSTMLLFAAAFLGGCFGAADEADAGGAAHSAPAADGPGNRVDIPTAVRTNLGITFVTVEPRQIERTLRVPGRFEFLPSARREYRTMLSGRIELLASQYDHVEPGDPLYRIESPAWRELQQQLVDLDAEIRMHTTTIETYEPLFAAHDQHEASLRQSIVVWESRLADLDAIRAAGGGSREQYAEARAMLATAQADVAATVEKHVELTAARARTLAELEAARSRREFRLTVIASVLRMPVTELLEPVARDGKIVLRWAAVATIDVRAEAPGIVESLALTNGAWADEKTTVLTTVQPDLLRFHAQGLQSDLGRFRDGLAARIVPPVPTRANDAIDLTATMEGTLALGISGHPDDRTLDLYLIPDTLRDWARPGVSAHLEIVTDGTSGPTLAVPLAAVQRDGLSPVLFRRDPADPNRAIRLDADLGMNDGRWVEVRSGVRAGDEVVLDGAFQLMLATSGSAQKGGHFHADGTFHESED